MKKENVIQLHAVKEERFYQQKHALVVKVKDFVSKKIPLSKQYQLHTEFKRRTDHTLNEQAEKQFFDFSCGIVAPYLKIFCFQTPLQAETRWV